MRHLHQDFELKKKGRIMGITGNEQGSTEDKGKEEREAGGITKNKNK